MDWLVKIHKAEISDIIRIRDIAYKTWPHTFGAILSEEQINYMLSMMYSVEALSDQINKGHQFFIAGNEKLDLAFIGIESGHPRKDCCKIHKLYVLPEFQGKGIGKLLISKAKEICLSEKLSCLNLNVNRFNPAVEFYKTIGFEIILEEDIDIGNGFLMEDYQMELKF